MSSPSLPGVGHQRHAARAAWLLAQGDDIVPIPGTRSATRIAENAAAADVHLTDADLARVQEILPEGSFGSRYPVEMMPDA